MDLPKRTRFVVTCGAFMEEMSAIRTAELISSKGFKATVMETDSDPTANITAAMMLIAEQLSQICEKLDIFMKPAEELQVVNSEWPTRTNRQAKPKDEPKKNDIPLAAGIHAVTGDLGSFLRSRRIAMNMTRLQVARRLGIGENQILRYENGVTMPRKKRLIDICAVLDISNNDIEQYLHK